MNSFFVFSNSLLFVQSQDFYFSYIDILAVPKPSFFIPNNL